MLRVQLDPAPDVQVLGEAALISGAAARDACRVLREGIELVVRRDGINPPLGLLQALAALQVAAAAHAARQASSDTSDIADVRQAAALPALSKTEIELIDAAEVAHMSGLSHRQAQRLAPVLGGRKVRGRWVVDRRLLTLHLSENGRKSA